MSVQTISKSILGVGVDDTTLDLFESQYPVPAGVSYNSYVILDEKTAILDTVDQRATDAWMANLVEALAGRTPDYLVVDLSGDRMGDVRYYTRAAVHRLERIDVGRIGRIRSRDPFVLCLRRRENGHPVVRRQHDAMLRLVIPAADLRRGRAHGPDNAS